MDQSVTSESGSGLAHGPFSDIEAMDFITEQCSVKTYSELNGSFH